MRPDIAAALRLAARHLWHSKGASTLCALAMALPMSAVVAASVIAPGSNPDGAGAWGGWWTLAMIAMTAQFAAMALLLVGAMVGAAMLVSVRRNERILALLSAVGAPGRILFLVVSAHGILIGTLAAVFALAIGVAGGGAFVLAGGGRPAVDAGTLGAIALATVLVGWAMALVPARATSTLDVTRVLRDAPRPARNVRQWGRAGHRIVLIGLGVLAVGAAAGLAGASLPAGTPTTALRLGAMLLSTPAVLAILAGAVLALPSLFRLVGRKAHGPGSALRFAARDAERGGDRSLATAASIMIACFLIGSYVSSFGANDAWTKEQHPWSLQRNQVAVELIGYAASGGSTTLARKVVDDPATLDAAARILEETFDTTEPRVIDAAPGPHWGMPVDENEGYSGFYPVTFPPGGLPHPRLEPTGACALPPDEGGPEPSLCAAHPHLFELPQLTPTIWAGDADDLALMLGRKPDTETLTALAAGAAIALDPRYLAADDTVTLEWWGDDQFTPEDQPGEFLPSGTPLRTVTLDGVSVAQSHPIDFGIFLSRDAAEAAGLDLVPARILAQSPRWLDDAATMSAGDALSKLDPGLGLVNEVGPPRADHAWSWGATGIAGGITLVLAISAIGLSRFEGSRTDATLHALGAGPGIRRRINASYALLVVGLSAVIGTATGALSIFGSAFAVGSSAPHLPLGQLGVMAVLIPLAVSAIAWLLPVGAKRMPTVE